MKISARARRLYNRFGRGWNTWNASSVLSHVYLPNRLEVRLNGVLPRLSGYCTNFVWKEVRRFGEHALRGEYTEIDVEFCELPVRVESAAFGDELVIRITPLGKSRGHLIAAEAGPVWGGRINVSRIGNSIMARAGRKKFRIDSPDTFAEPSWNPCLRPQFILKLDTQVYVRVNSRKTRSQIDRMLAAARKNWLASTVTADGALGDGLEGLRRVLLWNTIWENCHDRPITVVSRNWCQSCGGQGFGPYVLFEWDTFFAALMLGLIDRDLAYANVIAMLEEILPNGLVPNFGAGNGPSYDRSEPQVGAWCIWKLYLQYGDKWLIDECFDRLLQWNRWRFRCRDKNGDGLLELGSDPVAASLSHRSFGADNKQAAMWESGLDNSPMWDDAKYNPKKHCLELSFVGLNALMVADCEILAKMAALLGRTREQNELEKRGAKLARLINGKLWHEKKGTYLNRHWNGKFSHVPSLTNLYPLIAGMTSERQTRRLIEEHLLNPGEFWGRNVVPNIGRSHPSFKDQAYWRGRIWGPTNFLVCEGVRRARRADVAAAISKKSLDLFVKVWREKGVVAENYNTVTGMGGESWSDRFYHWGALCVYLAVQELFDLQAWDDQVRIRSANRNAVAIRNLPFRNMKLDITRSGALIVKAGTRSVLKAEKDGVLLMKPRHLVTRLTRGG